MLIDHLSKNLETFTGDSPVDEGWKNTFGILMYPLGAGPGGVAPIGPKSILYKHSHDAYQIKGNEE